jgi:CSLREA domain-containing protein
MSTTTKTIAICALLALGLIAPAAAAAKSFPVTTQADTTLPSGCVTEQPCSLRDAIKAASASADPEDVVEVPAGSYLLTAGELSAAGTGALTIRGAGARSTTIDAQGKSRVLMVTADQFTLEGVTVTGGVAPLTGTFPGDGGGLLVEGGNADSVTLNQVNVSGNTASLNGGGIALPAESVSATSLTVNASTIANNRIAGGVAEGLGGGIFAFGNLTIANSTIAGNRAENPGTNQGGGILASVNSLETKGTTATLLNSTIAGNSVAVGGIGGGFTVYNPVVGVATAFAAKNTIVAGNTAGPLAADCGTVAVATSANNLSSDASCQFGDAASKQNANPLLGPLQDNGGQTNTLALLVGSPAIDAGTNAGCPPIDQRGVTRPQGSACDIGAYEFQPAPPPAVAAAADLKLTVKPKPKHPHVGGKLAFLMTVANRGPSIATGIVLKGTAPASARKIKGKKVGKKQACKLTKVKKGKRKLTCKLGSLAAGKKLKLKVLVKKPAATVPKLRVKARVRSAVADPIAKNNKAKSVVKVKEPTRRR